MWSASDNVEERKVPPPFALFPACFARTAEAFRKRVLHIAIVVPGHLLSRRELELADAEAGPLDMTLPTLDFIETVHILHRFHCVLHLGLA
jgi:hypothetical protein